MSSNDYTDHHYVPKWYQRRFLPTSGEAKCHYLDLTPETFIDAKGVRRCTTALRRWGAPSCFQESHLYTTRWGDWHSTDIEKFFFGKVDDEGARAVEWFSSFRHPNYQGSDDAFHHLLTFMSVQKLRTPKGLGYIAGLARKVDKNTALLAMQKLQNVHCAIWSEAVWALVDANTTYTKFIISDHPVTVYNRECFPDGEWCRGDKDPDIWLAG